MYVMLCTFVYSKGENKHDIKLKLRNFVFVYSKYKAQILNFRIVSYRILNCQAYNTRD